VLVVNLYSRFATVIDPYTASVVAHHEVPAYCTSAVVDSSRSLVYLANKWLDQVLVYDLAMNPVQIDPGIVVGANPGPMAIGADGKLYVGNLASWDVSVVDLDSRVTVGTIFLGSSPSSLAAHEDRILVTNHAGIDLDQVHSFPLIQNDQTEIVNQVTWIDTDDGSLEHTWVDLSTDYEDVQSGSGLVCFAGAGDGTVNLWRDTDALSAIQRIDLLADGSGLPGGRTMVGFRVYTNTRAIAIADSATVYAANYDRDTLVKLVWNEPSGQFVIAEEIALNSAGVPITALQASGVNMTRRQNGERYLNTIASWRRLQTNFTCGTCHPDAHTDFRFLYDHTQDPHNPPNDQGPEHHPSLLGVSLSGPYSWEGVNNTLPDFNRRALDTHDEPPFMGVIHVDVAEVFLPAFEIPLRPDPNPNEQPNGNALEPNAPERGRLIFYGKATCDDCHGNAEFTGHGRHNVGTGRSLDTPHLLGLWDRGPYLHDGRAATLPAVLDTTLYLPPGGAIQAHGDIAALTEQEKSDLVAFLLSITYQGNVVMEAPEGSASSPAYHAARIETSPNPFRDAVRIDFSLARPTRGRVAVIDLQGRRVRTLLEEIPPAGTVSLRWDGRDDHGRALPAGVYWVRIGSGENPGTVKLLRVD
jgi:hypothetical protein